MASGSSVDKSSIDRRLFEEAYISPLEAVRVFFEALSELRAASVPTDSETNNERLPQICERVLELGEKVVHCLHQQMKQQNRATETAQEVNMAFRIGLRRLVQLRAECDGLNQYIKELNLAEYGLDARGIKSNSNSSKHLVDKQRNQRGFTLPGSKPTQRAISYEDFRKQRDLSMSSRKSVVTDSSSSIRKAKSDTDIAMQSLKKKAESLTVDNDRLKKSEKKLLKENVHLTRKCKTLEQERDRAEDRLKIEQTQRDSIELLRQRNKELEAQLRKLCDTQVIRERGGPAFTTPPPEEEGGGGGEGKQPSPGSKQMAGVVAGQPVKDEQGVEIDGKLEKETRLNHVGPDHPNEV